VIFMESDGLVMYSVYLFVLSKVITVLLVIHGPIGSQWREGERIARRVRTKARCCTCSQFEREVGSRGGGGGGGGVNCRGCFFRPLSSPNERNMYAI
jgi:hypothetical protein